MYEGGLGILEDQGAAVCVGKVCPLWPPLSLCLPLCAPGSLAVQIYLPGSLGACAWGPWTSAGMSHFWACFGVCICVSSISVQALIVCVCSCTSVHVT